MGNQPAPSSLELAAACHALQPVSALLAGGARGADVFACVAEQSSTLVAGARVDLLRVGEDGTYIVGSSSGPIPAGGRCSASTAAPFEAPITVDGRVWGSLVVLSASTVPHGSQRQLRYFAELVAGAVAYAQAASELAASAAERAALRRIHAVAGRGGSGAEVLAAVAIEGSAWLGSGPAVLLQFTVSGAARVVADSSSGTPVDGAARDVDDELVTEVLRSGKPARVDDYSSCVGGRLLGRDCARAAVGVPVVLAGRTWGMFVVGSPLGPMPLDAENRLVKFTEAIVPTILSAQARSQLANEQLALRRVAQLVARGADSDEVLATVVQQAAVLAPDSGVLIARCERPDHLRVVAADGAHMLPVGAPIRVTDRLMMNWAGESDVAPGASLASVALADAVGLDGWTVVPVTKAGVVWGILGATSRSGPLPREADHRLEQFADMVAAALVNAQARAEIQALADEQAALRRIAEMAARDVSAEQILNAVALEALALTGVESTVLLRYDPDGSAQIIALVGLIADGVHVGARSSSDGDGAVQRLWRTGRPVRIEDLTELPGRWAELGRRRGFTTSVAVPITMGGSLWGAMVANGKLHHFPASIESQLSNFSELTSTAVTAVQARRELRLLAEEQAALGRVAGLVVRGADIGSVCTALAAEASGLLDNVAACLWRREADGGFVLVAQANSLVPTGARIPPCSGTPLGDVLAADLPARIESFEGTPIAEDTRRMQIGPTCAVPIRVEGNTWGKMTVNTWQAPLPADAEERLQQFAELAGAAIANAENKAKLTTSRARVVATADETRRRLQRDVHDAAQQRLVHTIIALKLARQAIADGAAPDALVDEALTNAERASSELRDVVRGILPAALTSGGLRAGLESLLSDLVVPVDLVVTAPRCPAHVELTAYFVIAEALTNVVKHAHATRAAVLVSVEDGSLAIEVRDDGIGGADPARGTGLLGLTDRVDAVVGSMTLESPAGEGTVLRARLPLTDASQAGR